MSEPDYDAIYEGQCPHGHGPLERQEEHGVRCGWCDSCKTGWSIKRTADEHTLNLHFVIENATIDGKQLGPGIGKITADRGDDGSANVR